MTLCFTPGQIQSATFYLGIDNLKYVTINGVEMEIVDVVDTWSPDHGLARIAYAVEVSDNCKTSPCPLGGASIPSGSFGSMSSNAWVTMIGLTDAHLRLIRSLSMVKSSTLKS